MADELDRILNDLGDELKGLTRVLQSTFKIFDKGNKTEKEFQSDMARIRRQVVEGLRKEGKINEEVYQSEMKNIKAQEKNTGAIGIATKKVTSFGDQLGFATKFKWMELGKGIIDTGKNFMMADRKVEGFGDALKGFDGLSLLGVKLSDLGNTADFNVGIFKQLSQTGAGFGKSVIQLRNAALAANMPILDFVDLISTNSTTLARLFGTVMDGMPSIQGFTTALRERTRNELAEFGLNLDETSEFLITQLEIQRARGNSERVSQMDLVSRTVEYAKNLTKLSKLTGIQVSELDATNRQLAVEGAFQASLLQLNQKGRDATTRATAAMENLSPELATVIKDITQFGVATLPVSQAFQVANPQIIDFIKQLNEGSLSSADFVSRVKGASNTLGTDFAKALADASKFGLPGFEEFLNSQAKLAGSGLDTADKQMKVQGDNTALLVGFNETIKTLKTQAESISTDVFGKILKSDTLGNLLETISGSVEGLTGSSVSEKLGNALGNGFMFVKEKAGAVKEYFTKGEDGKGFLENAIDNDPNTPGIQVFGKPDIQRQELPTDQRKALQMFNGSDGMQDFGSGTPATLHGIEAVVPKNDYGQLAKVIEQMTGNTGATPPASDDMQSVNTQNYLRELVELNKNAQRALNTLVTVSAMTEKNTKSMNNNVANMGGSLV
jgi:uncharacterized protein YoxC